MPPIIFPFRLHKFYVTSNSVQCVVCSCYRPIRRFTFFIFCVLRFVLRFGLLCFLYSTLVLCTKHLEVHSQTQCTLNFNNRDERKRVICAVAVIGYKEKVFFFQNQFMFFMSSFIHLFVWFFPCFLFLLFSF